METGGWPRRSRTVRAQRRTPAPRPSSTHLVGLAADCDPLGPHLILLDRRWIAICRNVLPDGNDLVRSSTTAHARDGRERHRPDLVTAPHRDRGVWVLKLRGQDRTGNGHRFIRIVAAPAVMREGRTSQ